MTEDDEAPSTQLSIHITPSDLKKDLNFQKNYVACKLKLQNMILWWQRSQANIEGISDEECGKRIKMSQQMMQLLDDCSNKVQENNNQDKRERPKLHNKGY